MINGKITKIKNKNGEVTFPVTSSQAVMMSDGVTSVEDALNNIDIATDAQSTTFDNSSNGMIATNVQDAIEENKTNILSLQNTSGSLSNLNTTSKDNLVSAINEVFQSVSNGKELIASAITDKGVTTSKNDSFEVITNNIKDIKTGVNVNIGDELVNYDFNLIKGGTDCWINMPDIPYQFYGGGAVVYNNEIHLLGGSSSKTKHYKWNGVEWTSVSTLPYNFYDGAAVVYNNEIHLLGGSGDYTKHCKWNGNSWTDVSTLPHQGFLIEAIEYNNELHIFGGNGNMTAHYKLNGNSWEKVSTIPYKFYGGGLVIYNNEVHILGSYNDSNKTKHYKWNGSTWSSVSTLPNSYMLHNKALIYNNALHLIDGSANLKHYKWDGSSWTALASIPYTASRPGVVLYGKAVFLMGSYNSTHGKYCRAYTTPYVIN